VVRRATWRGTGGEDLNTRNLLTASFLLIALLTEGVIALSLLTEGGTALFSRGERNAVTVLARGPAGLRIEGRGSQVSIEKDASALTFKVPLAPLDTGIGLRDLQFREMLEAGKYPDAVLRVSRAALTFPRDRQPAEGTVDGDLTLHGQSRPVKVHYRAERARGDVTRVRGSLQLDIRDFDLKAPSVLGMTVAPRVEVNVELSVKGA
jgi:hypothetical protein